MSQFDENGFYKESSMVTITRKEYERLIEADRQPERLSKLNRPPDIEYRKGKNLFNIFGRERR